MKTEIRNYIEKYVSLSQKEFDSIIYAFTEKKLNKKDHFIRTGQTCKSIIFFVKGYFRFYNYTKDGNEVTSDFYFAPGFITSYTSFISGNPSFVNVQAMEKMIIWEIQKEKLNELYLQFPKIERLGRLIAESVAMASEKHLFFLLSKSAEERYLSLLSEYPEYIHHIPLQYIASYLGITQETLSRIRKSLI
jgi:CRP-like cAMP-binding protein